jgi:multimeric flavodoxin WrbA
MKIVALNGSPRLVGNTTACVTVVFDILEKEGFETEHVQMYGSIMTPCNDCGSCSLRGDGRCINEDDDMNSYLEKIVSADAVIFASPSYYGTIPGQMKILLERIFYTASACASGNPLKHKIGAAIAVQGSNGGLTAYNEMVNMMLSAKMTVCGSTPLPIITGTKPSEALKDKEGMKALKDLAQELIHRLSLK